MIRLVDQPPGSKTVQFRRCCPNCRQVLMTRTHQSYKDVTCPRCLAEFSAQHRSLADKQQDDASAIKVKNPVRWLVVLSTSVLILTGAVVVAAYRYQPSPPSSALTVKKQTSGGKKAGTVMPEVDNEEDLTPEFVGDLIDIPAPPSPDLSDLAFPWPVALDIPVVMPAIEVGPLKVEPDPQQETPLAPIQPSTIIQPLGGLTWDDDLLTAFRKVMDLAKSKPISVKFDSFHRATVSDEGSLLNILKNSLYTSRAVAIDKPVVQCESVIFSCYPVLLKQGAFQVDVVFCCEPGYTLDHAHECLAQAKQIFGPDADFYLPLRLQKIYVTLREHTKFSTLDLDAKKQITAQIFEDLQLKYASREHISFTMNTTEAVWQDQSKCRMRFLADPSVVQLVYEYKPLYFSELNQRLRKLQEEISRQIKEKDHIKKFTGSEDQSDKL